jgi:hypothetical protein
LFGGGVGEGFSRIANSADGRQGKPTAQSGVEDTAVVREPRRKRCQRKRNDLVFSHVLVSRKDPDLEDLDGSTDS